MILVRHNSLPVHLRPLAILLLSVLGACFGSVEDQRVLLTHYDAATPAPVSASAWTDDGRDAELHFPAGKLQWMEIPDSSSRIDFDAKNTVTLKLGSFSAASPTINVEVFESAAAEPTQPHSPMPLVTTPASGAKEAWLVPNNDESVWDLHVKLAGKEAVLHVGYKR